MSQKFYNNYLKTYLLSKHQVPNIFLLPKLCSIKLNISLTFTWNDELILYYWFLVKKFSTAFNVKVLQPITALNQKIAVLETKISWTCLKRLKSLNKALDYKTKKKIGKTTIGFFPFLPYYYLNFKGHYKLNKLDYVLDRFELMPPPLKFYILYDIQHTTSHIKLSVLHLVFTLKNLA